MGGINCRCRWWCYCYSHKRRTRLIAVAVPQTLIEVFTVYCQVVCGREGVILPRRLIDIDIFQNISPGRRLLFSCIRAFWNCLLGSNGKWIGSDLFLFCIRIIECILAELGGLLDTLIQYVEGVLQVRQIFFVFLPLLECFTIRI